MKYAEYVNKEIVRQAKNRPAQANSIDITHLKYNTNSKSTFNNLRDRLVQDLKTAGYTVYRNTKHSNSVKFK